MKLLTNRRTTLSVVGAFAAMILVVAGVWFFLARDNGPTTPSSPPGAGPSATTSVPPTSTPATMTVKVYFNKRGIEDPRRVVPVERTVPYSSMVATAALTQLLAGPTAAESGQGYWSFFSSATADVLHSVRIGNGVGHADFRDFSRIIPNASTSSGSAALLAELDATLKQFGNVTTTVYSFNGDVTGFYQWLQLSAPVGEPPSPKEAVAIAQDFLVRVAGMTNMQEGLFRSIGSGFGAAEFYPAPGPDGKPRTTLVTTVLLQRTAISWSVVGVGTDTITVDVPTRLQSISSPVTVSGRALAYEGHVGVRVLQVVDTTVTELGRGYVTGGGDVARPFSGQIAFQRPSAAPGWVVFDERSAVNGEVLRATVVQVVFAGVPAPPQVLGVTVNPDRVNGDGWMLLPNGAGKIVLTVNASAATKVEVYLTPNGAATGSLGSLLGTATRNGDTFTYTWNYRDEPVLGHLTVVATGTGGSARYAPFNAYHA